LLRRLADDQGRHLDGLQQAARCARAHQRIPNSLAKKFIMLDTAYNIVRHMTKPYADKLSRELDHSLSSTSDSAAASSSASCSSSSALGLAASPLLVVPPFPSFSGFAQQPAVRDLLQEGNSSFFSLYDHDETRDTSAQTELTNSNAIVLPAAGSEALVSFALGALNNELNARSAAVLSRLRALRLHLLEVDAHSCVVGCPFTDVAPSEVVPMPSLDVQLDVNAIERAGAALHGLARAVAGSGGGDNAPAPALPPPAADIVRKTCSEMSCDGKYVSEFRAFLSGGLSENEVQNRLFQHAMITLLRAAQPLVPTGAIYPSGEG